MSIAASCAAMLSRLPTSVPVPVPVPAPSFVIDTHSHVISDNTSRFPRQPLGGTQSEWSRERPVNAAGMLKAMRDAGVMRAMLVQASTCYGNDNRYIAACVQANPGAFTGVFSADLSAADAVQQLEHGLAQGLSGVRVFIAGHTAADATARLDDPRAEAAWAFLTKRRVPVCVQLRADKLAQLQTVLERHPDATVLLDHCARPELSDGAPYRQAAALFALARYPGLHLKYTTHNVRESALGLATPASWCRRLVDVFGAHRIAWGSNFPASPGGLAEQLRQARAATAALSEVDRDWIFAGTACRLYAIEEVAA